MHRNDEMPETVSHVAGLILARGGSQGIPLKNIALLSSHPLLIWSLGAMKAFGRFDSLWVSTDHASIAACAASMGASVFCRSAKFAKCGTPSVDAVQEFLESHPEVDIIGLVQCTSPFLQPEYLSKAYDLIKEEGYDSVFSVTRDKKLRWSEDDFFDKVCCGLDETSIPKQDHTTTSLPLSVMPQCQTTTNVIMHGGGDVVIDAKKNVKQRDKTYCSCVSSSSGLRSVQNNSITISTTTTTNQQDIDQEPSNEGEKVLNGCINSHKIIRVEVNPAPGYAINGSSGGEVVINGHHDDTNDDVVVEGVDKMLPSSCCSR